MRKFLLLIAAVMVAMTASAQGVFLRGNGDWGTPADMEFTKVSEGVYELAKEVTLTSAFKIADASWGDINYGSSESAKIGTIAVTKGGSDIKVTSTINATKITLDINAGTLTIAGAEGGAIQISTWTICGVGELVGDAWDPASTANVMTESNGVYTLTKEGVALTSDFLTDAGKDTETLGYGYKVAANGKWGISEFPASGNQFLVVDANGTYNVTFTWNPASEELSAVASLVGSSEEGGDEGEGEGEGEGEDDPIIPIVPGAETYYLIGYINGADYGCEADYENMGDYKFVDGTLTATFEADSYVFIKTEGNGKWFLTEAYTEETSAVFAEGNGEKMFVPGGQELTFTLVENGDGSLTLSYTIGGTSTDLEDVDAEDAVVAAYDITGKPVAADAKGLVILQYASGKAVKVFN